MEIIKYLENNKFVQEFQLKDFKTFNNGFYLKIFVKFIDNSELYITEYTDETERNYSYHWQNADNEIIFRWDNAPYHKNIATFPHHVHTKNGIFENYNTKFNEILNLIEENIKKLT